MCVHVIHKAAYFPGQCSESDLSIPMPISETPKKDDDDGEFETLIRKEAEKSETAPGLF